MFWLLAACGSGTPAKPPTPKPDADATKASVDALCKLFEGADKTCTRGSGRIESEGHVLTVAAELLPVVTEFGMATLRGFIHVEGPEGRYSTRIRGSGGNKKEALERGIHEWALVSGVAVADIWLGPTRPALAAVEDGLDLTPLELGGASLVRGWPLYRPEGEFDHGDFLKALEPAFDNRRPEGMVSFEITRQSGEVTVDCWLQDQTDAPLCDAARAWSWPGGIYELRLAYAVKK